MHGKNQDLHGNVPDRAAVALLIVDMINDFDYPGGDALFAATLPAAERITALKRRAKAASIPVLYINDNFGRWRSDFREQVRHCLEDGVRGEPIARMLQPEEDDYFILKPKHSAFYETPLDLLLKHLQVSTLILTGIAGDSCILFTAGDAFLRDFQLFVPSDCTASQSQEDNDRSLERMRKALDADIRPASQLEMSAITPREAGRTE